jgi:hypothetical protein
VLEKRQPLQQKILEKLDFHLQKTETRSQSLTFTGINSKWINALHVRPETVKLIQEKIGNTLDRIGMGNNLMNGTPVAQQLRERTDKWDCMKLKSFCSAKGTVTRLKR